MTKQRTGRGPLVVTLQDTAPAHPRLTVRDGNGLLVVLPVAVKALPAVRAHLDRSGPGRACDLELVDERGEVASRWGTFTAPGAAAAVAVALLGADRELVDARVVAPGRRPVTAR